MKEFSMLKLELDVASQRFQQHIVLHNEMVEDDIKRGMQKAFEELSKDDYLANLVRDEVFMDIRNSIKFALNRNNLETRLTELVNKKITSKLETIAEEISQQVMANFKR